MLEEYLAGQSGLRLRTAVFLPYEEWESGTSLRPFRVGPLRFAPPWADPWPGHERETVLVDPGVTFGSGFHESTRGCLELLIRFWGREKPERVLDLGTGSGILALAAARLGARRVLAVDLQPVSVETARANVVRNGLEDRIEVRLGDALQVLSEPADLILANLHLDLLKEIVRESAFQKAPWSILSGLAGRQVNRMKETLGNLPLRIVETRSDGAWSSLLLARDG
jgi:ribosomal protein L11 methyltransferase